MSVFKASPAECPEQVNRAVVTEQRSGGNPAAVREQGYAGLVSCDSQHLELSLVAHG